jgi:hypothetical protein
MWSIWISISSTCETARKKICHLEGILQCLGGIKGNCNGKILKQKVLVEDVANSYFFIYLQ